MTFDNTLSTAKDLQEAGMDTAQAEAVALAIKAGQGDLATKADIRELKNDINWLKWGLGINIVATLSIIAILITDG